ncbi:hypothetical protein DPMN_080482 [Dreissena polymorpha]|uniref:Uncharacterized protein n=1 Tax=Dreissena polymorpha TaxID=45954 RepID=A0A9D3YSS6_DREPO|nr:hypothetical protein DPMN_080482 [Dreissena polymorpha]
MKIKCHGDKRNGPINFNKKGQRRWAGTVTNMMNEGPRMILRMKKIRPAFSIMEGMTNITKMMNEGPRIILRLKKIRPACSVTRMRLWKTEKDTTSFLCYPDEIMEGMTNITKMMNEGPRIILRLKKIRPAFSVTRMRLWKDHTSSQHKIRRTDTQQTSAGTEKQLTPKNVCPDSCS